MIVITSKFQESVNYEPSIDVSIILYNLGKVFKELLYIETKQYDILILQSNHLHRPLLFEYQPGDGASTHLTPCFVSPRVSP